MRASVVIPSFNSTRTIRICLDSVVAQRAADCEVIVVDDASTDGSLSIVREYSQVKVVALDQNHGPGFARNIGAREGSGKVVIFLDADCYLEDMHWIDRHLNRVEVSPDRTIVGGAINADGPGLAGKAFTYNNWYVCHPKLTSLPWGVRHLQSTNISILKSSFDDIGGFDEFLRAGEDVEFCVRAVRKGYVLNYDNTIIAHHLNRSSIRQFIRVNFDYGKTRIEMKHKGTYGASFLLQENRFLNAILILPLSTALTLRILSVWLRHDLKVVLYLPFVFFGQLIMVLGVFRSLRRQEKA